MQHKSSISFIFLPRKILGVTERYASPTRTKTEYVCLFLWLWPFPSQCQCCPHPRWSHRATSSVIGRRRRASTSPHPRRLSTVRQKPTASGRLEPPLGLGEAKNRTSFPVDECPPKRNIHFSSCEAKLPAPSLIRKCACACSRHFVCRCALRKHPANVRERLR